jgi:hypothetical protein
VTNGPEARYQGEDSIQQKICAEQQYQRCDGNGGKHDRDNPQHYAEYAT